MRVTQITTQKRKGRVNLFIDGEFAAGLHEDVLIENHIYEDDDISDAQIKKLLNDEKLRSAKDKALRLLTYRPRSVYELKTKLKKTGYNEQIIDHIIADLLRVGLLDDSLFAESFARTKIIQRPLGKRLMFYELRMKGIDDEIIEKTIAAVYSEYPETALAGQLVQKKIEQFNLDENPKEKKRLIDLLKRRGFQWDIIEQVLTKPMDRT